MPNGLTASQEIVEVRVDNNVRASLADAVYEALADKPEHRIVTMSSVAMGEFPLYVRVLVVIEYVG